MGKRDRTHVLLPLSEAGLFGFDLFGEAFSKLLLFFLELGVVDLLDLGFSKLSGLHLLLTIVFVVEVFRGRDEVQHVGPNKQGAELAEVTVVFVLYLSNTPEVFTSLDNSTVRSLDILRRADDGEGNGIGQHTSVFNGSLVIDFHGRLIDTNALGSNNVTNAALEQEKVVLGKCIRFRNHRDQVDTCAKSLHDFDVKRFETTKMQQNKLLKRIYTSGVEVAYV